MDGHHQLFFYFSTAREGTEDDLASNPNSQSNYSILPDTMELNRTLPFTSVQRASVFQPKWTEYHVVPTEDNIKMNKDICAYGERISALGVDDPQGFV